MKPTNEPPKMKLRVLLTREEVAKTLNCSLRTVDYFRKNGGLPCIKIGALVRFDEEQLVKWLDDKKTVQEVG